LLIDRRLLPEQPARLIVAPPPPPTNVEQMEEADVHDLTREAYRLGRRQRKADEN
jgi:hypothetical protein